MSTKKFHCCDHCPDDPDYHENNPVDSHDTSCGTAFWPCDSGGDRVVSRSE